MGLPNILRALRLLEQHPNYRFTLDQVCYVKPFLERYPEQEGAFRRFVEEGRLALVGGTYVMPDVNMPGGESFVRQVLFGKRYFRATLGVDVTVGWQLDTFGHHAQMPQLLTRSGYTSFWFMRGVADPEVPAEFFWEGIDGARIPAFWLPRGYGLLYSSPKALPEFARFFQERFEALAPFSRGRAGRVGLAGADVCVPEEHLPLLVDQLNSQGDAPFQLHLAVPGEYEAFVSRRPQRAAGGTPGQDRATAASPEAGLQASPPGSGEETGPEVIRGELNPIFQGTYSSRIELKQWMRELEGLLTTIEKLGALLKMLKMPVNDENLWRAWEPVLFNQAHDLMSGVMTDEVYEDTKRGFDFSRRLATDELSARLRGYASRIDTQGVGIPLVVLNTLGWTRTDVAFAHVGFTDGGITDLQVLDAQGRPIPAQFVQTERDVSGALLRAEVAFLARDIPALGHCVYRLVPLTASATSAAAEPIRMNRPVIENEHHRVEFDATGAITALIAKADAWNALRSSGNVLVREQDQGDLWELYRPLRGDSRIAMRDVHGVSPRGQAVFSDEQTGDHPSSVTGGQVFSEFSVAHRFGNSGQFSTCVRVYAGLRRIHVHTRLLNNEKFVRYRALFPTSIENGQNVHEIPFGALQRPLGIEFPAQNWVDYSDGRRGLALLNRGLPGNNVVDGTMVLSLCRSTRIVAYGFGGGYEPGMSSDSGLDLGKELSFQYALVPHPGNWEQAGIYRDGMEFNNPLVAVTSAPHAGTLPCRWGFLEINNPSVVLSALKPGEGSAVILRVYEAAGKPAKGIRVAFAAQVTVVKEVNLVEDAASLLAVTDGAVQFDLGPFEIKTLMVTCESLSVYAGATAVR